MKLLLLLFILMQGFTGDEPDCKAFYEKTLYPIAIKGDLICFGFTCFSGSLY